MVTEVEGLETWDWTTEVDGKFLKICSKQYCSYILHFAVYREHLNTIFYGLEEIYIDTEYTNILYALGRGSIMDFIIAKETQFTCSGCLWKRYSFFHIPAVTEINNLSVFAFCKRRICYR